MAKNSRGQEQKGPEQREDRAEAQANDAKWKSDEPHQRRQNQHRHGHRPRQDQQDAPDDEQNQKSHLCSLCGVSSSWMLARRANASQPAFDGANSFKTFKNSARSFSTSSGLPCLKELNAR